MASSEVNMRPQPMFWGQVATLIRSVPRSALLSMVGPLLLCVVGYFGWRYYGAPKLDMAYYGLSKENIHVTAQPKWLTSTNVLDEVFAGSSLSSLSLLDAKTPVVLARVFDAHPCVRKTHRVQKMAGQVMINLEYRMPVAMVCFPPLEGTNGKDRHFAVDVDSVLLDQKNFDSDDIPKYIAIYPGNMELNSNLVEGKPFGDSRVEEAVRLCAFLMPLREAAQITRIYVYKAPQVGKSRWLMEIFTKSGPRIVWGSAPGMEGLGEPTAETKLNRLSVFASDSKVWSEKQIDLSGSLSATAGR